MTDKPQANSGHTMVRWGPWAASGIVLVLYLTGQIQSCARNESRIEALERMVPVTAGDQADAKIKIAVHDASLQEIGRRLLVIETILRDAPWYKPPLPPGGDGK